MEQDGRYAQKCARGARCLAGRNVYWEWPSFSLRVGGVKDLWVSRGPGTTVCVRVRGSCSWCAIRGGCLPLQITPS